MSRPDEMRRWLGPPIAAAAAGTSALGAGAATGAFSSAAFVVIATFTEADRDLGLATLLVLFAAMFGGFLGGLLALVPATVIAVLVGLVESVAGQLHDDRFLRLERVLLLVAPFVAVVAALTYLSLGYTDEQSRRALLIVLFVTAPIGFVAGKASNAMNDAWQTQIRRWDRRFDSSTGRVTS